MFIRDAYCIVLLVCLCIIHIHIHYPYCIFLYVYASRCYGLRLSVFDKETTYLITYLGLLTSCRSTLDLQVRRLNGMLRPLRWPVLTVVVYRSLNGHIDLWRVSVWTMWHERICIISANARMWMLIGQCEWQGVASDGPVCYDGLLHAGQRLSTFLHHLRRLHGRLHAV